MANKVTIIIDADGKAYIDTVEQVEKKTEDSKKNIEGLGTTLKSHWLAVSAAIYGAIQTMQTAWNLASQAAQYEEQRASLNALAAQYNTTADSIVSGIKAASNEMISLSKAVEVAGMSMARDLKPDQIIELAAAAETLSNVTGNQVSAEFENLAGAIALGRERALEATVGIIDLNAKFGDQVAQMSDAEKQAARYALVMERVREIKGRLGEQADSTGDKMERLQVQIEDLKLVAGAFVIKGGLALYGLLQGVAAAALFLSGGIFKTISALSALTDWLGITSGASAQWELDAKAAFDAADDLAKKSGENLKTLFESNQKVVGAYAAANKQSGNESESTARKIEDLNKSLREEIGKLNDEYNRLTMSTSEYTATQENGLIAKGAEIKLVRELTAAQQKLNEAKAAKEAEGEQARAEEGIRQIVLATEKLGASKERVLELEALELSNQGALPEQIDRYIQAREKQMQVEAAIEAEKTKRQAEQDLVQLARETPYEASPQNFEGNNEIVALQARYQQKLGLLHDYNAQVIQAMIDSGATQEQIFTMYNHLEAESEKKKQEFKLSYAAGAAGAMANIMQDLYVATGSKNKAMFEAMKMFAIAETVISTYKAAQDAYAWGMRHGGPVAPYLAAAAAATAVAAGMARVQAIRSQQPGSSSTISSGGTATSSYGGGSPNAYPPAQRIAQVEKAERPMEFSVHIYGDVHSDDVDKLARKLVAPLQKAWKDGVR